MKDGMNAGARSAWSYEDGRQRARVRLRSHRGLLIQTDDRRPISESQRAARFMVLV